jgi:protein SCO1
MRRRSPIPGRLAVRFFRYRPLAVALLVGGAILAAAPGAHLSAADGVTPPRFGGHFSLHASGGQIVTDRSFPGKWLLIYFGYTYCPDACPTALAAVGASLAQLGPLADRVQPIFITVDPQRDTPQILAEYVKNFDPRLIGLTGSSDAIAAAAKDFRVYFKIRQLGNDEYAIDHSSFLYVVNPQGQVVELLTGNLPGHSIAEELRRLVK